MSDNKYIPKEGDSVTKSGRTAKVITVNYRGKGTVKIEYLDSTQEVVHHWQLTKAPGSPVETTEAIVAVMSEDEAEANRQAHLSHFFDPRNSDEEAQRGPVRVAKDGKGK